MKLDRTSVRIIKKGGLDGGHAVRMTNTEAVLFMWELTREVYSLSGNFDVESRLQRHVVFLTRKAG
jgi:hypothetical protein